MKFKGITFRRNDSIGFRDDPTDERYTEFFYKRTGEVIPKVGNSLTNMAYAADGRVLLAYSGQVFTAPKPRRE